MEKNDKSQLAAPGNGGASSNLVLIDRLSKPPQCSQDSISCIAKAEDCLLKLWAFTCVVSSQSIIRPFQPLNAVLKPWLAVLFCQMNQISFLSSLVFNMMHEECAIEPHHWMFSIPLSRTSWELSTITFILHNKQGQHATNCLEPGDSKESV